MNLGITDRLAVVTGASRGIGRTIAAELAREGARVALVARSENDLEAVRREMTSPDRHRTFAIDLMAEGGAQKLADSLAKLGNLDIIIHNLGGGAGIKEAFAPVGDWKRVWDYNVGVGHALNCLLIPGMIERGWGRIVHLSTLSTTTYQGSAAYVSAKCALDGYVRSISREISKHGVIVSAVAPGAISIEGRYFAKIEQTDRPAVEDYFDKHLPIRRFGTPQDVAAAVAFLCSEQASYMAGAIVAVDGGWL
jgi:3-oxoacyl-[acyl-carrier protein] reductase